MLFLVILGAASVKAQVRIGGNAAPNASAVLDLNADNTNSGTKGLALPRVALTSNTMLLPGVTANLTGMLVYNTSTTGTGVNRIGIYYWNGATWVLASLPSTSTADSGYILRSNGLNWVPTPIISNKGVVGSVSGLTPASISWTLVSDAAVAPSTDLHGADWAQFTLPGLTGYETCLVAGVGALTSVTTGLVHVYVLTAWPATYIGHIKCYRPSA